jgi:hypothetical protein
MAEILMPKATAVWLIEETSLSFDQIAEFCGLHPLEVQGIANEDVAKGIRGVDPISAGFLTRDEIARGEANEAYRLQSQDKKREDLPDRKRKTARYVPTARRGDRPDAVAWFVRNHPEVPDSTIIKLIGTTKNTIEKVRTRTHWNSSQIKPVDPVSLGLCTQIELDEAVRRAATGKGRREGVAAAGATLRPAHETVVSDDETVIPADSSIDDDEFDDEEDERPGFGSEDENEEEDERY